MGVDELIADARAKVEGILAPIDGGVGADASYDAEFEGIKAEVEKMQSLEGGKVEWGVVAQNSTSLLEERSKDFRLALYLIVGRSQTEGIQGIFEAFVALDGLIQAFWEPMYPALKRPRARGNLCPWVADFVGPVIDAWTPTVKERDLAFALEKTFRSVDGELADKLGDAYPGMGPVREALRRLLARVPAEAPPPPPPPPPKPAVVEPEAGAAEEAEASAEEPATYESEDAGGGGGGGGGGGYSVDDIQDTGSAYQVLGEVLPLFQRAAEVFREADATSAEARRFSLVGKLLFLNAPLPSDGGATEMDGPDAGVLETVVQLAGAEDWDGLLRAVEGILAEVPLWLDGYFYAVQAFQGLEGYDGARRAVEGEIAALAIRAPGVADLSFAGGVPFASDDAKAWIKSLGGGGGGAPAVSGGGKDPLAKVLTQAAELVGQGQVAQAVAALQRAGATAPSPLVRFRARLEAAKIALGAGYADLARAQLDGLDRLVERHRLDEWDPDLVTQLHTVLYQSQRAAGWVESEVPEQRARATATFERLCQLDGTAALRMLAEGAQ